MPNTVSIRPAAEGDLPALREIERAAGELFRTVGMDAVAEDEPLSLPELRAYVDAGRAWVADRGDEPVGYLLVDVVDGSAHVEQVSVAPAHARQGLGRQLLSHAARWAAGHDYPALTLTTFSEVPWNGPYYERCGFRYLAEEEVTPELRARREHEAACGLDRWPRACMRRELGSELPRSPGRIAGPARGLSRVARLIGL